VESQILIKAWSLLPLEKNLLGGYLKDAMGLIKLGGRYGN